MDGIPRLPSKVPGVIEAFHDAEPPARRNPYRPGIRLGRSMRGGLSRLSRPIGSVRWVTGQPHIALTYDDGPDPVGTEAVLEHWPNARRTATFFVLVGRARRYRTLLDEVTSAGHEIGLHGVDPPPADRLRPPTRCTGARSPVGPSSRI